MDISFGAEHDGMNLGGVLLSHLGQIKDLRANLAVVSVHNEIWYGTFLVPLAVGFSTPVSLLAGARLALSHYDGLPVDELVVCLQEWSKTYSSKVVNAPTERTFTNDLITCAICGDNYEPGQKIYQLNGCKHQFHYLCIAEWIVTRCDLCGGLVPCGASTGRPLEARWKNHCSHVAFGYLSGPTTCPICRRASQT